MAYKDTVRDLGNHVKIGPNTKGTSRRGNPLPDIGKTELAPATENPVRLSTVGNAVRALRDLGPKRKVKTKI